MELRLIEETAEFDGNNKETIKKSVIGNMNGVENNKHVVRRTNN